MLHQTMTVDVEALKRDFVQALADLNDYWGREKNYSWTITPGQQADIVALVQPFLTALERIPKLEGELSPDFDTLGERLGRLIANLEKIEPELPRLLAIQAAVLKLIKAKNALNDPQVLGVQPYQRLYQRLQEAWAELHSAVEG